MSGTARVAAIYTGKELGFLMGEAAADTPDAHTATVGLLLDAASFYAESGGQVCLTLPRCTRSRPEPPCLRRPRACPRPPRAEIV